MLTPRPFNIYFNLKNTITFICKCIAIIYLFLTLSFHRGFSTGSSAVILDIDSCDSSFLHYYDYNVVSIFILNITDDCSIRTALQCSHESDAAVECVGELTSRPGNDFYHD